MTIRDIASFSLNALISHRLRTGLSLVGMTIGVAAVVLLTALGEGARLYVVDQFASIGSDMLIIMPGRTDTQGMPGFGGAPHDLSLNDAETIQQLPSVANLAPVAMGTETVSFGERRRQVAVIGSTEDFLEIRRLDLARGENLPAGNWRHGRHVVIIGQKVASELFGAENPLGKILRVGGWRLRVTGILSKKGMQLGVNVDDLVIVPVSTAMKMFNRSSLFRIMVIPRKGADPDAVVDRLIRHLTERHGEEDITIITQESVVASLESILSVLTLALAAIAAISLAVAGIGIMNVMLVSVSERTSEIGLLKALGADRRQLLSIFLTEALFLSILGGLTGLGVGFFAVQVLVSVYPAFPAEPPLWAVISALTVAMGMGTLFGVLPARHAADLDPVQALTGK